jgi:hypothetical protein
MFQPAWAIIRPLLLSLNYSYMVFIFYRSAGDRQGQFKMPSCKPSVPVEDVFSQEAEDFETSYLEVIYYIKLRTGNKPKSLQYAVMWSLI